MFSGLAEQARCRWGAVHTTVPELLEPGRVVCRSAARPDLEADSSDELFLALNALDFSPTGENFSYFIEAVANISVMAGPAGGPSAGGTALTIRGTALEAVTHCQFGNSSASAVLSASAEEVVCPSTAVDSFTGLDGAMFEGHVQLDLLGDGDDGGGDGGDGGGGSGGGGGGGGSGDA